MWLLFHALDRIHRRNLMIGAEKEADADFEEVFDLASVCGCL